MSNLQNDLYQERMQELKEETENELSPFELIQKIDNFLFNLVKNK